MFIEYVLCAGDWPWGFIRAGPWQCGERSERDTSEQSLSPTATAAGEPLGPNGFQAET